jgi:TRAP-type C4-dicarboxylate transport system permease small subunit
MDMAKSTLNDKMISEGPFARGLRRFLEPVAKIASGIAVGMLFFLLFVVFLMVVCRSFLSINIVGLDDLARYLQIWVVYAAAIPITMKGDHIVMDAAYNAMPSSWKLVIRKIQGVLSFGICGITGYLTLRQAMEVLRVGETSSSGVLPAFFGYVSLPFGFLIMCIASLYFLFFHSREV